MINHYTLAYMTVYLRPVYFVAAKKDILEFFYFIVTLFRKNQKTKLKKQFKVSFPPEQLLDVVLHSSSPIAKKTMTFNVCTPANRTFS